MVIYNKKDGLYLQAWAQFNNINRYVTEYEERMIKTEYYKPEVLKIRESYTKNYCDIHHAFDYGCGWNPWHYNKETESSPLCGYWDKYTPKFNKFNQTNFFKSNTLLMYDVLEHMYDPHSFLMTIPQKRIIMTIPLFPSTVDDIEQLKDWKHYREGEHYLYANEDGIIDIIEECGWNLHYLGYDESVPNGPREDIATIVIRK